MRAHMTIGRFLVGATLLGSGEALAQQGQRRPPHERDELQVRRIVDEEVVAWNAGDAQAYARHFALDGTFTNIYGMVFEGRDQFERRHAETFADSSRGVTGARRSVA